MSGASHPQISRTIPVLIAICLFPFPANAKYNGGSGTADDPYRIATAADLIALGETPADYDKHFLLTADIDLDPNLPGRKVFDKAVIAPDVNETKWEFEGTQFAGVFDGNRHSISHLVVAGVSYLGLFGQLRSGAEVRDLGVVDVHIVGSGCSVGGLVGANGEGERVRGGNLTNCYSTGAVSGGSDVSGLVGDNYHATPTQCFWDVETSRLSNMCGSQNDDATGCDNSFGKTTAQMRDPNTFMVAGWDFVGETANGTEDIWWILEGKDYPRLWWELIPAN